jgi:hypothetical protein
MPWCTPAYGQRSFDLLPGTIERLLTGTTGRPALFGGLGDRTFDRVVLVYLDAFGWRFVERHADHPLLARARDEGLLLKLTSQFPSTTAAHATTIHSGLPLADHGVYEWFVYEPLVDRLIAPLLFSFAGDDERGTLPLAPTDVFPDQAFYADLAEAGVQSFVSQSADHAFTPPNQPMLRGARSYGYSSPEDGLAALRDALADPGYGLLYLGELDGLMHDLGPDAPEVIAAMDAMLTLLDRSFFGSRFAADAFPDDTLVLLTADHGMAPVDPATTLYVNELWPALADHLRQGADGKPLAPAGSCRDLFLHALPESVAEVVDRLAELLDGRAEVRPVADLLDQGLFGANPSERLCGRLANVAVLPFLGESVYWREPGRFEQTLLGQHGGLTAEEMEIPLLGLVT